MDDETGQNQGTIGQGIYMVLQCNEQKLGFLVFTGDPDKIELFARVSLAMITKMMSDKKAAHMLQQQISKMYHELEQAVAAV